MRRWVAIVAVAAGAMVGVGAQQTAPGIFGFTVRSESAQREIERRFLALPSADRARDYHRYLTDEPHVAGSDRNKHLAEWMRDRWKEYGLDTVEIVEHEVLLPFPTEMKLTMGSWEARFTEDPVPGDPDTQKPLLHYNAYSRSGEVEAPIVYAASGNPDNYDWLESQGIDVRGKIVLVRYSVPYSYRGFKALTAQRRGAAAMLIYSDPAEDGAKQGRGVPGRPVGQREPHPVRRHSLRLHGAGRSAHARLGVGARRPAHTGRRGRVAAEDHQRAAVGARRAGPVAGDGRAGCAGGVAGRPRHPVQGRAGHDAGEAARDGRRQGPHDPDGHRHDPRAASGPTSW